MNLKNLTLLVLISITSIICLSACKNQKTQSDKDNYEIIKDYLYHKHNFKITDKHKKIIVLTENGCPSCNEHFLNFVENNLTNNNEIVLVFSDGTGLDISGLLKKEGSIFFDSNIEENYQNIFDSTSIWFIEENKIDTIITINSFELLEQIEYINTRITTQSQQDAF